MDIGRALSGSWALTIKYPVPLIAGWLVAAVIGGVSLGILAAPTMVAVMMMYVRAGRGETPEFGHIFRYLNQTIPLGIATLVVCVLVFLGLICLVIPGLVLAAWWIHTLLCMVDGGMKFGEAMRESKRVVQGGGTFTYILFFVILTVIMGVGSALAGLGVILTGPLTTGALAMAYANRSK